jgi:hypothetical protein
VRPLVVLLASALAWPAYAQEALPEPPSPDTPSGTSVPPAELVKPRPTPPPATVVPPATAAPPVRRRPNVELVSSGAALLGAGWLADIGFTYGYDHHPASTSLIPLAGPWIQLSQRYGLDGPPINTGSATADASAKQTVDSADRTIRGLAFAGEITSGLMQAAGLALAVAGAITKGKPRRFPDATTRAQVSPLPHLRSNGMFFFEF